MIREFVVAYRAHTSVRYSDTERTALLRSLVRNPEWIIDTFFRYQLVIFRIRCLFIIIFFCHAGTPALRRHVQRNRESPGGTNQTRASCRLSWGLWASSPRVQLNFTTIWNSDLDLLPSSTRITVTSYIRPNPVNIVVTSESTLVTSPALTCRQIVDSSAASPFDWLRGAAMAVSFDHHDRTRWVQITF